MANRIARKAVEVIAGLAAMYFFFVGWRTDTEILANAVSLIVLIICWAVLSKWDDDNTSFWPKKTGSN